MEEPECCENCIYFYDESTVTSCTVKDWMKVSWDNYCECFDNGKGNCNESV